MSESLESSGNDDGIGGTAVFRGIGGSFLFDDKFAESDVDEAADDDSCVVA